MPAPPPPPDDDDTLQAIGAARRARGVAGDEVLDGEARSDAFAALLYGMALPIALARTPGDDGDRATRVADLAVRLLREVLGIGLREATRVVDAIGDALAADEPDAAVQALVHEGAQAAHEWLGRDLRAFDTRVLRATAADGYASARPLRGR